MTVTGLRLALDFQDNVICVWYAVDAASVPQLSVRTGKQKVS